MNEFDQEYIVIKCSTWRPSKSNIGSQYKEIVLKKLSDSKSYVAYPDKAFVGWDRWENIGEGDRVKGLRPIAATSGKRDRVSSNNVRLVHKKEEATV